MARRVAERKLPWLSERERLILMMRRRGHSYRAIGAMVGISRTRVRSIVLFSIERKLQGLAPL